MADYSPFFIRMKDDTIKQVNPFTGTEVWTVPGRASKPITNAIPANAKKIEVKSKEDYCNFCETNYLNTPPEKERMVRVAKKNIFIEDVKPLQLHLTKAALRRIPNLFEIVTMEYWRQNYGYTLPEEIKKKKQEYLDNKKGYEHVMNVINMKLKLLGKDPASISDKQKEDMADAFFGGGHELIVGPRHYIKNAEFETQLFSAGDFTPSEHFDYIKFTIRGMMSIYKANRYVRYVSIFQNWLKPAGASFDHLHKQLVAIDERGVSIERELKLLRQNPNIYNEMGTNLASHYNLVVAENDHAVAFSDIGHRYPTVSVFSKSEAVHPHELPDEELKGFSDILHAVHNALTSSTATNEEWYYTPRDAMDVMPLHVLVKLRVNMPAGFEGGTKIYINPMSPYDLRDKLIDRLYQAKKEKAIGKILIGEECKTKPNCLRYSAKYYRA